MATAKPDESVWQVRCKNCGQVLAEGKGDPPSPDAGTVPFAIKEAVQAHQLQTGICDGKIESSRMGRITED